MRWGRRSLAHSSAKLRRSQQAWLQCWYLSWTRLQEALVISRLYPLFRYLGMDCDLVHCDRRFGLCPRPDHKRPPPPPECTCLSCFRYLGMDCHLILRMGRAEVDRDPGLVGNLLVDR